MLLVAYQKMKQSLVSVSSLMSGACKIYLVTFVASNSFSSFFKSALLVVLENASINSLAGGVPLPAG